MYYIIPLFPAATIKITESSDPTFFFLGPILVLFPLNCFSPFAFHGRPPHLGPGDCSLS